MHKVGGIDRKSIDIWISGKTYTISFVSVFARKSAVEFQQAISQLIQIQSIEDAEARTEKLEQLSIEDLSRKVELRDAIIQNILESNGYDYDGDWWEKNTSYEDQNEFIKFCLMKDVMDDGKKKEAEA